MIRKFNLSHFYNTAEGTKTSKNRDNDRVIASIFNFETFYISRYFQDYIKQDKLFKNLYKDIDKKDKITELVVTINMPKNSISYYKESRIIAYKTTERYEDFMPLRGEHRASAILSIILKAAKGFEEYIPGIENVFIRASDDFIKNNFRHIWVYQKKKIHGFGIAKLVCELTMLEFKLDLAIEDKGKKVYKKRTVFKTLPDSIYYYNNFKSLLIDEKYISITGRLHKKPRYKYAIKEIVSNVQLLSDEDIIPKNVPTYWVEFKNCLKTPEGTPCPSLK